MVMVMNTLNIAGLSTTTPDSNQQSKVAKHQPNNDEGAAISANVSAEQVSKESLLKAVTTKNNVDAINQEKQLQKDVESKEDVKALEDVASNLQDFVNLIDKELKFTVDTESGRHVVTIKDGASGEIIRQIPSEEVLKLAQNLAKITDVFTVSGKLLETQV